ncbi:MAG: hypothetical protein ACYCOU_01825 [Sulfobacillus sp.]
MITKKKLIAGVFLGVGLLAALGSSVNLHGNIINADIGYQLGAQAPSGHTLVGNGSEYVDSGTLKDEYNTVPGCAFANDGANLTCSIAVTLPTPMPDTSYSVACAQSFSFVNTNWTTINTNVSGQTTTGYTLNEITSGSSTIWPTNATYGFTAQCHAHHN